jgi:hypothetical protein
MDLRIDEEKNIAYIKLSGLLSKKVILSAFDLTLLLQPTAKRCS